MESTEHLVDSSELTRLGQTVCGQAALSHFKRLTKGLPAQGENVAEWSVRGMEDVTGQQALEVHVRANVVLQCQRCMQNMTHPVDSTSVLQVVQSESEIDALEDQQDSDPDTWIEPVLASRRLNLLELVEDELILSVPYVPKHATCSHDAAPQSPADDEPAAKSPFSVLTQLKKN